MGQVGFVVMLMEDVDFLVVGIGGSSAALELFAAPAFVLVYYQRYPTFTNTPSPRRGSHVSAR